MNYWYPGQDPTRAVFLQSCAADSDKACGLPPLPSRTCAESTTAAQAWLVAYARCQGAQRSLGSALLALQAQVGLAGHSLCVAARQTERRRGVPVAPPAR